MQKLRAQIRQYGDSHFPVLIEGESGSGKEIVARCMHRLTSRRDKPYFALNCAAISPSLLEPTLFGYAKGAFTGATQAKSGYFEDAEDGTLFLDEIGELPLELQPKLLRVLENGEFQRVGETQPRVSRARVIAATNRDLKTEVAAQRFRQDLYYRLQVLEITLPPLRERPEDIALLVRHFMQLLAPGLGLPPLALDPRTLARMADYDWPGNVRELRNLVERSLILGWFDIGPEPEGRVIEPAPAGIDETLEAVEKRHILAMLAACEGNKSEASRRLGISRKTMDRKCQAWGI